MGADSTISLLRQANGFLKQIVDNTTPVNQQQKNEDLIRKVHKGEASAPQQTPPPGGMNVTGVKIADIAAYLSNLPETIKKIANLKDEQINSFKEVMDIMSGVLLAYAEEGNIEIGAKNLDKISKSVSELADAKLKQLFTSFVQIDRMKGPDHMYRVIRGMNKALNATKGIKTADINKLKQIAAASNTVNRLTKGMGVTVASVIALTITIDKVGAGNVMKGLGTAALIMTGLTGLTLGVAALSKLIGPANNPAPILGFVLGMQGLTLTTLLVGKVVQEAKKDILAGFAATSLVLVGYTLVTALVSLVAKETIIGAKDMAVILGFSAASNLLVMTTLLTGMVAKESAADIAIGFGATAGIMAGYVGLAVAANMAMMKTTTSVKDMAVLMGVSVAATALVYLTAEVGEATIGRFDDLMLGLTETGLLMIGYSKLMSIVAANINGVKVASTAKDIAMLGLVGAESLLIVGGALKLSEEVKKADMAAVLATFTMTGAMMMGIAGVGKVASSMANTARKGIVDLALIGLLAAGSLGIVKAMVGVAEKGSEVGWDNMFITLGAMASVVTAFGVLAGAAGAFSEILIPGSIALGMVELVAFGAAKLLTKVVDTNKVVDTLGEKPWLGILETIGQMGLVVTAFATLSAAATAASLVIIPGAAALGIVTMIANKSMDLLIHITDIRKQIGPDLEENTKSITGGIKNTVSEFASIFGIGMQARMVVITAGAPLLLTVAAAMSTVSKIVSNIALIGGPNGTIRAAYIDSNGNATYGEYVDIVAATTSITGAISTFVTTLTTTFRDIKLKDLLKASIGMAVIGQIVKPVSMFADTMLGFQEGADGTIHSVRFAEDGTIITGPDVKVELVAQSIAGAIGRFCSVLFSEENTSTWANMISGTHLQVTRTGFLGLKRNVSVAPGTAQQAMGVFALVVEPLSSFAQTLAMFGTENGTIAIPIYDSEGKLTGSRPVDVKAVAESLAGAVTSFVEILASKQEVWHNLLFGLGQTKVVDKSGGLFRKEQSHMESNMESAMGIFSTLVTPVVSFANMIAQFGSDGQNLIVFDKDGNSKSVNVIAVATNISGAVNEYLSRIITVFQNNNDGLQTLKDNQESIHTALETFTSSLGEMSKLDPDVLTAVSSGVGVLLDTFSEKKAGLDILSTSETSANMLRTFTTALKEFAKIDARGMEESISGMEGISVTMNKFITDLSGIQTETLFISISSFKSAAGELQEGMDMFGSINTEGMVNIIRVINSLTSGLASVNQGGAGGTLSFIKEVSTEFNQILGDLASTNTDGMRVVFDTVSSAAIRISSIDTESMKATVVSLGEVVATFSKIGAAEPAILNLIPDMLKRINDSFSDGMSQQIVKYVSNIDRVSDSLSRMSLVYTSTDESLATMPGMRSASEMIENISLSLTSTLPQMLSYVTAIREVSGTTEYSAISIQSSSLTIENATDALSQHYENGLKANNKYGQSIIFVKNNLMDLDKVLNEGNNVRIRNIDNITDALERMGNQAAETIDNLNTVKEIFTALNSVDTNKANTLLENIAQKLRLRITHDHTGQTLTQEDMENALRSVLGDLQLTGTFSAPDNDSDEPGTVNMELMM